MSAVGIIAEYNPFHYGHLYHLKKVKEMFPEETIVLLLGGTFTQRGDLSILTKWEKTKIALEAGIDLIVELPFPFATAAADIFAEGAIQLASHLKLSHIVFGSETNDLKEMEVLVDTQLNNPDFFSLVQVYLRMGNNYPTALSKALEDLTGTSYQLPNDLLGISYLKAIKKHHYKIKAHSIKRQSDYHATALEGSITSATSIRNSLYNNLSVQAQVPPYCYSYLQRKTPCLEDYFPLLKYKIITEPSLLPYAFVTPGLEKKMKQVILSCSSWEELVNTLTTRNVTHNKMARMLLYILIGFTKEQQGTMKDIPYIRLLGFNDKGKNYLHSLKKDLTIPLLSKFEREKDPMLALELQVTKVYTLNDKAFSASIQKQMIKEEYQNSPIRKETK